MSVVVVDASVAGKWFAQEVGTPEALALLGAGHHLHAPDFLLVEMDNILWKWVRRGVIARADVAARR